VCKKEIGLDGLEILRHGMDLSSSTDEQYFIF